MGIKNFISDIFLKSEKKQFELEKKISENAIAKEIANIKRYHAGASATLPGSYSSGSYGSGGEKYPNGISGTGMSFQYNQEQIRQNARTAVFESDIAKSIQDRYSQVVVDVGIKADPSPDTAILGISDEQAEAFKTYVENGFDLWCQSKMQHRSGNMNFYQFQRLYAKFQVRDNDQFTRLFYSNRRDLLSTLQWETIDPNQIRGCAYTSTYAQMAAADGIEKNPDGTEKSYKIWFTDPATFELKDVDIPAYSERNGRTFMLHGFISAYSGQTRGISLISHVIQEFEEAFNFKISAIKKAIAQSSFALAVENDQANPSDFTTGFRNNRGVGASTNTVNGQTESTNRLAGSDMTFNNIPEMAVSTPGSAVIANLAQGDKVKLLDKSPSDTFESFYNTFTAYLAASCNIPHEILLMRFNANYNAARGAIAMFYRVALAFREELVADLLAPVYEMWISEEIAAGRLTCPGWQDARIRAAWLKCTWHGAPMTQLNPMQEMQATKGNLEMNLTTLDRASHDLNGSSGKDNRLKLAKEVSEIVNVPWSDGAKNEAAAIDSVVNNQNGGDE
jgi:capsid protein